MATLNQLPTCPRRSRKLSEATIKKNKSSLEILIQMGFPKHRAEKALAATGDTGVQLASDWLLSHVNDPTLDEKTPREYILYLCPVGELQQELIDFWHKSFQGCGWNRAHNYFPHITLCSFFKAEDSQVPMLAHMLKAVVDCCKKLPDSIDLEYFSSTNFIGLFVAENSSAFIKQLTSEFAEEAKKIGVTVEPHKKQLHISLAYQFSADKKDHLEAVAKSLNIHLPVRWDIRLYSRDAKLVTCQVRKVLYTHNPTDADELELVDGDFILVESGEIEKSTDNWYYGTSWLTGLSGMFPGPFTERCAESEIWTMHRSIPVVGVEPAQKSDSNGVLDEEEPDNTPKPPEIPPRGASISVAACHVTSKHNKPPAKSPTRQPVQHLSVTQGEGQKKATQTVVPPQPSERPRPTASVHGQSTPAQPPLPMMHPLHSHSRPTESPPPEALYAKVNKTNKHNQSSAVAKPLQASLGQASAMANLLESTENEVFPTKRASVHLGETKRIAVPETRTNVVHGSLQKGGTLTRGAAPQYGPRQLYVIRHGERIDFTFGKEWIKNSFDKHGNYIRYDLNMPKTMPKRKGGPSDFSKDSPLTIQGHFQAHLIGEAMKDKNITVTHVYASPSLRCVETASSLLKGLGIDKPINIEPGLFEWLGWYTNGLPKFMTESELKENMFNINEDYKAIWPMSKYSIQETTEQYYDRCHHVTKEIIRLHDNEEATLFLIAHKGSYDVFTRGLLGKGPRPRKEFRELVNMVPFAAVGCCRELVRGDGQHIVWELCDPGFPPLTHKASPKYDWKIWV